MEDTAYDSPSSDGHPSLPSPGNTTYSYRPRPPRRLLHPAASSPKSSSPKFSASVESSDDDDLLVTIDHLNSRPESSELPVKQRILESTDFNSSPPRPLRTLHGQQSTENVDPKRSRFLQQTRPGGGAAGGRHKEPRNYGEEIKATQHSGYTQAGATRSPTLTPDPVTGLPRRIVVRKGRHSPKKGDSPTSKPANRKLGDAESDADDELGPVSFSKTQTRGDLSTLGQVIRTDSGPGDADAASFGSAQSKEVSSSSKPFRTVSESTDTGSIFRHETLEQIDHTMLMRRRESGTPIGPTNVPSIITPPASHQDGSSQKQNTSDMINALLLSDTEPQNSIEQSTEAIINTMMQNQNSTSTEQLYQSTRKRPDDKCVVHSDSIELPFTPSATQSSSGTVVLPSPSVFESKPVNSQSVNQNQKTFTPDPNSIIEHTSEAHAEKTPQRVNRQLLDVEETTARARYKEGAANHSELDRAFPDNTPPRTDVRNYADNPHNPYTETPQASSTPKGPGPKFDLMRLKQSRSARRMSMNTPPSHSSRSARASEFMSLSLPSPLSGSEYNFPNPPTRPLKMVPREFSPLLASNHGYIDSSFRMSGTNAPPNSAHGTPAIQSSSAPGIDTFEKKGRQRSKSDPLDAKADSRADSEKGIDRMLFTPSRVARLSNHEKIEGKDPEKTFEEPSKLKSSFSDDSGMSDADLSYLEGSLHDGEGEYPSDDGNERRLWSGFSQEFPTHHFHEVEATIPEGQEPQKSQTSGNDASLSLENVVVRVQTPTSVGNRDSSAHTATTRLENNARKSSDGEPHSARSSNVNSGSVVSSPFSPDQSAPSTGSENEILRHQAAELATMRGRELQYQAQINELRKLVSDWQYNYNRAQSATGNHQRTVQSLERRLETVENELLEKQRADDAKDGDHETETNVRLLASKTITTLEQRFAANEQVYRDEIAEKDQTIGHLKAALAQTTQRPSQEDYGNAQAVIDDLRAKLMRSEAAHRADAQATEEKYQHILWERQSMINHLQAELDEMANLMPVDPNSSRTTEGEIDSSSWQEDRSREMNQMFEANLSHILAEIQGSIEGEEYGDEAAGEAEMSLRRLAQSKGYELGMDKMTLAAFGVRELRADYDHFKGLASEMELRIGELLKGKDELADREEELNKENVALQQEMELVKKTSEQAYNNLLAETETLEKHAAEVSRNLANLKAENQRLSVAEERANAAGNEKASLQMSLFQMKGQVEMWKSQSVEAEQRAHEFQEEIETLRRDLIESSKRFKDAENGFENQIRALQNTLSRTNDDKSQLLKQLEALRAAREELESLQPNTRTEDQLSKEMEKTRDLQSKLTKADEVTNELRLEITSLKKSMAGMETATKLAKGRFNAMLHDNAEKEAEWETQKGVWEARIQQLGRAPAVPPASVDDYDKILARILAEFTEDTRARLTESAVEAMAIQLVAEDMPRPETVAIAILAIRMLYTIQSETETNTQLLDNKNRRLKEAIKKWGNENADEKNKINRLMEENADLALLLKAEKKKADEKIGQLILALRR